MRIFYPREQYVLLSSGAHLSRYLVQIAGPPLLPFSLPFHQDPLGADFELVDFRTFHEAIIGEIWDNST